MTQGMDRGSSHDSYHGALSLAHRAAPLEGRPRQAQGAGARQELLRGATWTITEAQDGVFRGPDANDTGALQKSALWAAWAARRRIPRGGPTARYASTGEISCGASAVASKRGPVRLS